MYASLGRVFFWVCCGVRGVWSNHPHTHTMLVMPPLPRPFVGPRAPTSSGAFCTE